MRAVKISLYCGCRARGHDAAGSLRNLIDEGLRPRERDQNRCAQHERRKHGQDGRVCRSLGNTERIVPESTEYGLAEETEEAQHGELNGSALIAYRDMTGIGNCESRGGGVVDYRYRPGTSLTDGGCRERDSLETGGPSSVTPRTTPAEIRTVGGAVGVGALAELPGGACADIQCRFIRRHKPSVGNFDFTFIVFSAFWLPDQCTFKRPSPRLELGPLHDAAIYSLFPHGPSLHKLHAESRRRFSLSRSLSDFYLLFTLTGLSRCENVSWASFHLPFSLR